MIIKSRIKDIENVGLRLEGEKISYLVYVNAGYESGVSKVSLLLLGLLGQNMTFEGMFSFDFS